MPADYYSDRIRGPRPRRRERLKPATWGGIVSLVRRGIDQSWFGEDFPERCEDGHGTYGCNEHGFVLALESEIPDLEWPLRSDVQIPTLAALDFLEFMYRHASESVQLDYHRYYSHYHLDFDSIEGRRNMRDRINRLLSRGELVFELNQDGSIERLGSQAVEAQLSRSLPPTSDTTFDDLLATAVAKFHSPDRAVRREALEPLWDAFERMKTMLDRDKKKGVKKLIQAATEGTDSKEVSLLGDEMRQLTDIGNEFRIRHHETNAAELSAQLIDQLFGRMYALIYRVYDELP
jgi:AbiJ-like protein